MNENGVSKEKGFIFRYDPFRLKVYMVLLLLFSFLTGKSQNRSDHNLIDQVIKDFNIGKDKYIDTVVFLTHPLHDFPDRDSHFERLKADYSDIEKSAYYHFRENNGEGLKFDMIEVPGRPYLVDTLLYNNYSEIFSRHGNIWIVEFSNIGYSASNNQAFLYFGSIKGSMSSGGVYLLYEKKKSGWKLKKVFGAWAT